MAHGARLRFRSIKGLSTDENSISFDIGQVTVELLAAPEGKSLRDAPWFVLRARNFSDADDAKSFGSRLQTALQIASIRRFWGVDVGEGKATAALFKGITDQLAADGHVVRSNVHGLDIYEDLPGTSWFWMEGTATVTANPAPIIEEIQQLFSSMPDKEPSGFDSVRLLNEALISREPAAQLVLAIAAVEHLANGAQWTQPQIRALSRLAQFAESDTELDTDEKFELSEMLRKSQHRMSVRQSHRRLLLDLGLGNLWKSWDALYARRSAILHGLSYSRDSERSRIVHPALSLAARIVLTAIARQAPGAAFGLETILPISTEAFT